MSTIEFSKEEKQRICAKLNQYLQDELDVELGAFETEFLLDYIGKELGAYYYNRGLYDAQAVLHTRMESITDAIFEIEKPIDIKS